MSRCSISPPKQLTKTPVPEKPALRSHEWVWSGPAGAVAADGVSAGRRWSVGSRTAAPLGVPEAETLVDLPRNIAGFRGWIDQRLCHLPDIAHRATTATHFAPC